MDSTDTSPPRIPLPDWTPRHRFDVTAYHRMGAAGVLGSAPRVELIEGEILEMSPSDARHINTVIRLTMLLAGAAGKRARVSIHNPVRLDDRSEPEPDIALLRPVSAQAKDETPAPPDILLLVEIADSSLRYDKQIKLPLYARHGIPEVWLVDLDQRIVEVPRAPSRGRYTQVSLSGEGDMLAASSLEQQFAETDILPRL